MTTPDATIAALLDCMTDGFAMLDGEWRFVFLNRRARDMFSPFHDASGGLLGRNHWEAFPDTRGTVVETQYRRAMAEQVPTAFEFYYDKLRSWFEVRAYPHGEGLSVFFLDSTARRDAQLALGAERTLLRRIARGDDLAAVLDQICREAEQQSRDGLVCSVLLYDQTARCLRHGAAPSLSERYVRALDCVPVDDNEGDCGTAAFGRTAAVSKAIATDPRWAKYRELALADDLHACYSRPIPSGTGDLLGTMAVYYRHEHEPSARDEELVVHACHLAGLAIERRNADLELQQKARTLEVLQQTGLALGQKNLDLHAVLQHVTDAGRELSGAQFGAFFYNAIGEAGEQYLLYTLSGAPASAFSGFGHPRATPLFGPTFRGEPPIRVGDVLKDPRYGQWGPHHGMPKGHLPVRSFLAVPVTTRNGEVLGGLFFGHGEVNVFTPESEQLVSGLAVHAAGAIENARLYEEVTRASEERARLLAAEQAARSQAEHASAMKDQFLSALSHELRTPLSSILGWATLLQQRTPSAEDVQRGVDVIARNARIQIKLIEDLLDMSRIAMGKVRVELQPVDLASVVGTCVDALRPTAEAKGLQIYLNNAAFMPIQADPTRLNQVLWNLLSNAIKFTPHGGRVTVTLKPYESEYEVNVTDSGQGISAEFLPHVFDRFRQEDARLERRHTGLGLGLAIARQLVELHGGSIHAHSAGEGQGATFAIRLPRIDKDRTLTRDAQDLAGTTALVGKSVLVVDDEVDARELIVHLLREQGAQPQSASNVADALAMLEAHSFDLVVSDIGMPDISGYEFVRHLRRQEAERGIRTPVVAVTAFARPEDREAVLAAGFDAHVPKPHEATTLLRTLAEHVASGGSPRS